MTNPSLLGSDKQIRSNTRNVGGSNKNVNAMCKRLSDQKREKWIRGRAEVDVARMEEDWEKVPCVIDNG